MIDSMVSRWRRARIALPKGDADHRIGQRLGRAFAAVFKRQSNDPLHARLPELPSLSVDEFIDRVYHTQMQSSDLIRILQENGWVLTRTRGSHHQMTKDGRTVTVPHPKKDLGVGLVKAILKQAGVKE